MAFGILDDPKSPAPPGTVYLHDGQSTTSEVTSQDDEHLKKHGHIVLQPQPSDSPNDPLNWSNTRKIIVFSTIMICMTAIGGVLGMMGTAGRILSEKFHVPYPIVTQTLGPPATGSTVGAFYLCAPIAAVYGKRVQYVGAILMITITILTGIWANSLNYYRDLGIAFGIAAGPFELLMASTIADTIFIHQRGRLMAVVALISVIGSDASHIISGNLIAKLGIKYLYIVSFAMFVPLSIIVYLIVWETTFAWRKAPAPAVTPPSGTDSEKADESNHIADVEKRRISVTENIFNQEDNIVHKRPTKYALLTTDPAFINKYTWRQQLRLFRGRITDRSFIKSFLQPFVLMLYPSVMFGTLIHSAYISWMMVTMLLQFQVLLFPPYNLKPDTLSYIGLPGSCVNLIMSIVAGWFSDWLIKIMSKRNNGIYEPEYRILLMIPATIFSTIGFAWMGPLYESKASTAKIIACGLWISCSVPFATISGMPYIFDTMQQTTTEAFVTPSVFRQVFMLVITSRVPMWFQNAGPTKVFRTLMYVNLGISGIAMFVYIFGKRLRGAFDRSKFMRTTLEKLE